MKSYSINTDIEYPISRLAPTPSGHLHIGNIYNFILTWILVRKNAGKLILRIDDIDAARSRAEYIEDIFRTLDWLQIDYDSGPTGADDFTRHFSQQKRGDFYRTELKKMQENSDAFFACDCSRKSIQEVSPNGLYPGSCHHKNLKLQPEKTALRCRVKTDTPVTVESEQIDLAVAMGDFVVWRRDDLAAYQLVSLLEDLDMGVNLIVRGEDLLESTAAQLYLSENLPPNDFNKTQFVHHPLLCATDGAKLSKTQKASSIKALRESGAEPRVIYARVAHELGLGFEPEKLVDFLEE